MPGSFLEELEADGKRLRSQATKELWIPGTHHAVRFRPPPDPDMLVPALASLEESNVIGSEAAKQLLVDCCDEVLRRNGADSDGKPVDPDGGPLRFDAGDDRWGPQVNTARDCVTQLYHLDAQPLAHIAHANVLVDWLRGVDAEIRARAEGEFAGGKTTSSTPPGSTSTASTEPDSSESNLLVP